jgi:hypothetical protein
MRLGQLLLAIPGEPEKSAGLEAVGEPDRIPRSPEADSQAGLMPGNLKGNQAFRTVALQRGEFLFAERTIDELHVEGRQIE